LFLRIDFLDMEKIAGMEVRLNLSGATIRLRLSENAVAIEQGQHLGVAAAFRRTLEVGVPWSMIPDSEHRSVKAEVSVWQDGLPMDALPQEGSIEIGSAVVAEY
jgi:hypothetical protein